MSDGAPFQYNFFFAHSGNQSTDTNFVNAAQNWNKWLTGDNSVLSQVVEGAHTQFYNTNSNKNWWAEAIKSNSASCTVIDKTMNTTGGDNAYMTTVSGLGATMYTIGFGLAVDGEITVDTMETLLKNIATDESHYISADSSEKLTEAFTGIAYDIKQAGTNATFTDVMGEAYDLKMTPITNNNGKKVDDPTITVSTYELYKKSDVGTTVNGVSVTENMVGTRKSDTPVVAETVTFTVGDDGTVTGAYSNIKGGDTNILSDNKINAVNFTYDINSETFSWNVGTINEQEKVLTYYVYLTGSMEGTREAGSYPTNKSAVLTYTNYLDHEARKDTISPTMPWKSATVSYVYYLVNAEGRPVNSDGTVVPIAEAVKVTAEQVYATVLLNSTEDINANIAAKGVLPEGYTLYDENADYAITIKSGSSGGSWKIAKSKEAATTYVTGHNGNGVYSNEINTNNGAYDYTNTIVYFAVLYKVSAVPDTVVIDFGLPVDITVLGNDILGSSAMVSGLSANTTANLPNDGTEEMMGSYSSDELTATYGKASILTNNKVRYTPSNMEMDGVDTFYYAAKAAATNDSKYYYSSVTVIPAANIYYEDSFVSFTNGTRYTNGDVAWTTDGNGFEGKTQSEDRPDTWSLPAYDANNVYGYDPAYDNCTTYSMGSAHKVTVDAEVTENPTATFKFKGTGFDIISLTDNNSGMIIVKVKAEGEEDDGKNYLVNNYYGYTQNADGEWEVDNSAANNALYQIPVMTVRDLTYGEYTVTVTVAYGEFFDKTGDEQYSFWFDAVRIYDPAGKNNTTANEAYASDGEANATITELRNELIDKDGIVSIPENGAIFIDGNGQTTQIDDYKNYGPNNEIYLASNQAIAFKLTNTDNIASVQVAAKAPTGAAKLSVKIGDGQATDKDINTATEMYYPINEAANGSTIVIANTGREILSITNLKVTYKTTNDEATVATLSVDDVVVEEAPVMLLSMLATDTPVVDPEPVEPDPVEPTTPVDPEPEPEPEPVTFVPERFELSWRSDTVLAGQKATLVVKASEDVESIIVNGETVETYRSRTERGDDGESVAYREFTYIVTASEAADYSVCAVNANGIASEAETVTLTVVTASVVGTTIKNWLDKLFSRWF